MKIILPSPYDAMVKGEEIIFWEILVISFNVISSTAFRNCSKGFLKRLWIQFTKNYTSIQEL